MNVRALATLVAVASAASPDLLDDARGAYEAAKARLRASVAADPIDALASTVLTSAWVFYLAEREENPQVRTYEDALVFVSTCLSVGYANIFARTPAGKALAAWLMGVGPAMAARALDPPAAANGGGRAGGAAEAQWAVVDKLEELLGEVRAQGAGRRG
jgi:voltage-gated potassium channel